MKKFTLLIASLFITMGAMAQTPVLELTSEQIGTSYPYELTDEDAQKVYALTDLTVAVKVNTAAMSGRRALFCTADPTQAANSNAMGTDSYYVAYGTSDATIGYLASWKSGDRFTKSTVPANTEDVVLVYVINPTANTCKLYVNGSELGSWVNAHADGFMSGYEIATPKMVKTDYENAKIYIGGGVNSSGNSEVFNGTITGVKVFDGALTADEIANVFPAELPEGFVATPEEFVNGKVYTFVTQRGKMGTTATSANAISTAKTTVSDTNTDYFKWTVYESAKGNFYLYNLGKAMFLGEMSTAANASVPMSETPAAVTFKTSSITTHPIMFTTKNDGSCVANHSSNHGEGLITWNGGWTNLTDTGNGHQVVAVAELDAEILSTVEAAVNAFEADNTEAVAALDAAIANANAMAAYIGTEIGLYSYAGEGSYEEKFAAIVAFRNGITATNDPTPEAVEAKTAELNNIIASFVVNTPATGKYYRLKNAVSNNYMSGNADGSVTVVTDGASASSTIFYLDENNKLLSYTQGRYLDCGNKNLATAGTSYAGVFAAAYGTPTANQITYKNNGYWTFGNRSNGVSIDRGSSAPDVAGYNWVIEEVETLPVTVTEAGYATLYAPVALTVPTGVTAHTVTLNGEWATLSEALTTIPANTGVVLVGEGSHSFAITTADAFNGTNALTGSVAAEYKTEDAYVLAMPEGAETAGFYIATKNQNEGTAFLNNSHKAYLPKTTGMNAASYSFRFGEGTTGVEKVEMRNEKSEIYDLTGRRVENITAPGIYVVNGKKVLVK